jgi:NAD+ diphosphatase
LPDVTDPASGFVPTFAPVAEPDDRHHWFLVHESTVLIGPPADLGLEGTVHFLGVRDGVPCWGVEIVEKPPLPFTPLRNLYGQVDETAWTIACRAVQLIEWDRTHRYCGRCATATEPSTNDRSRKCPNCGLLAYPRLAPAVITLVTRGDEALLGRGVNFPMPMYSCLAGFVEPGETLEEAVTREVFEEVGVRIGNLRYVRSQPWPFPHSLMIGFRAEWESGEIVCDPAEISDAQWFTRDALPMVPPTMSIAGRLIEAWRRGD